MRRDSDGPPQQRVLHAHQHEELVGEARDVRGRFPDEAYLANREGFFDVPVVNRYAKVVWAALPSLNHRSPPFRPA